MNELGFDLSPIHAWMKPKLARRPTMAEQQFKVGDLVFVFPFDGKWEIVGGPINECFWIRQGDWLTTVTADRLTKERREERDEQ